MDDALLDYEWHKHTFKLSKGETFDVYHNLGDQIQSVFDQWQTSTSDYTVESFCHFVNEKSEIILPDDYYAYSKQQWDEIIKDNGNEALKMKFPSDN